MANRRVLQTEFLPFPGVLSGNDFRIIGVLSPDYATYHAVKAALRTLAIPSDQDTVQNGYSTFMSILRQVKWPEPTNVTVKPEQCVKKEQARKPIRAGGGRNTNVKRPNGSKALSSKVIKPVVF